MIRAKQRLSHLLMYFFFSAAILVFSGCGRIIKTTIKAPIPTNIGQDRTATFEELLSIACRNDRITSLTTVRLHVTLIRGKVESGVLQKYRSAPGYILLKRPDSLRLNIQHPLTHSSVFELLSQGDEFKAWDSRDNTLYTGKNSARVLVPANSAGSGALDFPGRPPHIFDAILPKTINIDSPGVRIALEEQWGMEARFYILVFSKDDGAHRSRVIRKAWIERTGLSVARQQEYGEEGKIVSDVQYSNVTQVDGFSFPHTIAMDRPLDGYSLKLEFEDLRINPEMGSDVFVITRPGAENVQLVEKGSS